MDTHDLRNELEAAASAEPPAPDQLRAGVTQRVRRRRLGAALLAVPLVIVAVTAGALVVARVPRDAVLDTASEKGSPSGTAPASAGTTRATVTDQTATTAAAPATAGGAAGDCGTLTITLDLKPPGDLAPVTCMIKAINASAPATLAVTASSPQGGTVNATVTNGPDRVVSIKADGSITIQLPKGLENLGGLFGNKEGASKAPVDCGTITLDEAALKTGGAALSSNLPCLLQAVTNGGTVTFVENDKRGGTMSQVVTVTPAQVIAVVVSGSLSIQIPEGVTLPEDFLSKLPGGAMGPGIPGLDAMGGKGGKGGWGGHRTTSTTVQ